MSVPDDNQNPQSYEISRETEGGICSLTYANLDVDSIIKSVVDDAAGATSVFIGTTRNSFKGKVVTRLEYQAYSKLAIKTMLSIIEAARSSESINRSEHHPQSEAKLSWIRCAIHHRLGTVPVGEPSIVIAVSSPHRKEAFVACEFMLEEVKRKAQIWKREYYEGEDPSTAEWKENT